MWRTMGGIGVGPSIAPFFRGRGGCRKNAARFSAERSRTYSNEFRHPRCRSSSAARRPTAAPQRGCRSSTAARRPTAAPQRPTCVRSPQGPRACPKQHLRQYRRRHHDAARLGISRKPRSTHPRPQQRRKRRTPPQPPGARGFMCFLVLTPHNQKF